MDGEKQQDFLHILTVGRTQGRKEVLKTLLGLYSTNTDPSFDISSTLVLWFSSESAGRLC